MSLRLELKPFNAERDKTNPYVSTNVSTWLLFLAAAGATLTTWVSDPFGEWSYELAIFLLAAFTVRRLDPVWIAIAAFGFIQLAFDATVYRYATLNGSLRMAALAATAMIARNILSRPERFLTAAVWFGFGVSAVSVVAYYTSVSRVLWMIPAPYPDVWGPFLSRNNFAQFLELILPIALWKAASPLIPAAMLAAGLASASRAGSVLLLAEAVTVLVLMKQRRRALIFVVGAVLLAALVGGEKFIQRLNQPDTQRPEIFKSALAMIAAKPWTGYGLGTFAVVYPEHARFDAGATVEHAHNDWLEWAAEGGIPFMLCWAIACARAIRPAVRSVWGIGVLAVFLHALVDDPFGRFGISAWACILMGAIPERRNV